MGKQALCTYVVLGTGCNICGSLQEIDQEIYNILVQVISFGASSCPKALVSDLPMRAALINASIDNLLHKTPLLTGLASGRAKSSPEISNN